MPTVTPTTMMVERHEAEALAEAAAPKAAELLEIDFRVGLLFSAVEDIPTMLGTRGRTSGADSSVVLPSHGRAGSPKAGSPGGDSSGADSASPGGEEMPPAAITIAEFVDIADAPSRAMLTQHLAAAAKLYGVSHRFPPSCLVLYEFGRRQPGRDQDGT